MENRGYPTSWAIRVARRFLGLSGSADCPLAGFLQGALIHKTTGQTLARSSRHKKGSWGPSAMGLAG